MERIVKGNILGIQMYGAFSRKDEENFLCFMDSVERLKMSLTRLFNAEVAELAMKHVLADTKIEISMGEVEDKERWEELYRMGVVYKSEDKQN